MRHRPWDRSSSGLRPGLCDYASSPAPITAIRHHHIAMYPTFSGPERRRKIDLGGSSSTYTQQAVLDSVRAQREQRLDHRRKVESAHKIQAWWRGNSEARRVKAGLKQRFDAGNAADLVEWTRLLVVGWSGASTDGARLLRWSRTILESENSTFFLYSLAVGSYCRCLYLPSSCG